MNALTLSRTEAAKLCGISPTTFDKWIRQWIAPAPLPGTRRWSRVQIERAMAGQSFVPPEGVATSVEQGEDEYEAWRLENDERDKHRPLHSLNQRQERALRVLVKLGVSTGKDIDGAGEATFRHLMKAGLAEKVPDGWRPTAEGRAEVERTDTWLHWHVRKR